jgi:hypothetical protein
MQDVSLFLSFHLHYFLCPPGRLPKELSEIFAPIPGGGHATSRELFLLAGPPMWRSMTAPSSNTGYSVRNFEAVSKNYLEIFAPIPGAPHETVSGWSYLR